MALSSEEIEVARLRLEENRLKFEERQAVYRLLAVFGASATFAWTAFTYVDSKNRESEARRLEASHSYLDRQIKLLEEATAVTARIAVAGSENAKAEDKQRFWELYWGALALVEGREVEFAMKRFGDILNGTTDGSLQNASLDLAHQCREELARSWNTEAWKRN